MPGAAYRAGPEWPDGDAARLRACLFQLRSGHVQELPDGRIEAASVPVQRVQLPQSSAVVIHQRIGEPEADVRREREPDESDFRRHDREAGTAADPARGEILFLAAAL